MVHAAHVLGPPAAWLLGPPGLLREVTAHLLESGDVEVMKAAPEAGGNGGLLHRRPPSRPVVAVLVAPRPEDWRQAYCLRAPIVLVADRELDDDEVVGAVLRGAEAVVPADSAGEAVVGAVEAVGAGGSLFSPTQARAVAAAARAAQGRDGVSLTPRETDIIQAITRGEGVRQTALALGISAKTVENLQSRLFRKLEVRSRAQAVARAHA